MAYARLLNRRSVIIASLIIAAASIGGTLWWKGRKKIDPLLPVVTLAKPQISDVEIPFQGSSQLTASTSVDIKPRISSMIKQVAVTDGAYVEEQQLLIKLDDDQLQAKLAQAQAMKQKYEAQLKEAKQEMERTAKLLERKFASQAQYDQQVASYKSLQADVANAEATINELKTQLGYTEIKAPFSGRASITHVATGTVVNPNDNQALLSITQVDPMELLLSVPEQHLSTLVPMVGKSIPVTLQMADKNTVRTDALVKALDNRVDPTTGTIKVSFSIPNPEGKLWAGQYVDITFPIGKFDGALVIPAEALRNSQKGDFVFVLDSETKVVNAQPVEVAVYLEKTAVIKKGLGVNDQIVTSGFGRITDGTRVQVVEAENAQAEE